MTPLPDTGVFERLADFPDACVDIVQFSCVRMDLAKDTVLTDTKTHVLRAQFASIFIFYFFQIIPDVYCCVTFKMRRTNHLTWMAVI